MELHAHLTASEKKALFTSVTITHRQLEAVHERIRRAIRQPAGFSFVLVHGPTGVGKTRMMESLAAQARELLLSQRSETVPLSFASYRLGPSPMPVLMIEAKFPDRTVFNRGQFYRTILKLLGEQTYPQQMQVDIHAEAAAPKRRRLTRSASESNDDPDLRDAVDAAMQQHGVRVLFVDEAHHMLYGKEGARGSMLQEQLEWLKSLGSQTGVLYVLVGTYDLFNFGKLSGQTARRCLPVHFPRYQLEREEDCIEFQSTLLELLRRVPLECPAERWVTDHWCDSSQALATKKRKDWPQKCSCHAQIFEKKSLGKAQTLTESTRFAQRLANTWSGTACMKMQKGQAFGLTSVSHPQEQRTRFPEVCPRRPILLTSHNWLYFYECSIGCIGLLKDWLLRAVSTALDDGKSRLSLDCVQDHALPVDIYRQMTLDAYEGEQRLNHTEVNREHVWRLLQGGELIAPVPPLPPRETPQAQATGTSSVPVAEISPVDAAPVPNEEAPPPPPPAKKTRARKKAEPKPADTVEPGSMEKTGEGVTPPAAPPKRSRKKKTADETGAAVTIEVKTLPESTGSAPQVSTDADGGSPPTKPKRTRRVGEPKPKRYPVGEKDSEQGM